MRHLDGPSILLEDGSILTFKLKGSQLARKKEASNDSVVELPSLATKVKSAARNQRLLVEMANGKLAVVQPDMKKVFPIMRPQASCGRAGISPDGKTIAIGNIDGSVRLVNVESGEIVANLLCSPTRNRQYAPRHTRNRGVHAA